MAARLYTREEYTREYTPVKKSLHNLSDWWMLQKTFSVSHLNSQLFRQSARSNRKFYNC